jgi:hypothetical protein
MGKVSSGNIGDNERKNMVIEILNHEECKNPLPCLRNMCFDEFPEHLGGVIMWSSSI